MMLLGSLRHVPGFTFKVHWNWGEEQMLGDPGTWKKGCADPAASLGQGSQLWLLLDFCENYHLPPHACSSSEHTFSTSPASHGEGNSESIAQKT